ncbi:MAG TPA: PTS IIA-like nitrogen regulatory protein PtsN [Gammaproteobacteria bacterium]
MQLTDILTLERVSCDGQAGSKKRVLEQLSDLAANGQEALSRVEIFDSLLSRERLGSTGLGHGIAIPHGRVKNSDKTIGAFLKLREGVDYDAIDQQPVDLLFALLVPEQSTEEHLKLLAQLAEMFSNAEVVAQLRGATTPAALLDTIRTWQDNH